MTNFEKIKAMDIDTLAKFLYSDVDRIASDLGAKCGSCNSNDCLQCVKNWLKSEVRK